MRKLRKLTAAAALGVAGFPVPMAQAQAAHPPGIQSISICSSSGNSGKGSCPAGSFDTQQVVLGTDGTSINRSRGFGAMPDEHYISLAVATSLDYGKSWPTYRGTSSYSFVPLPDKNAAGEFQINFTVPRIADGTYPVTIQVNGTSSPQEINSTPPGPLVIPIQH